MLIKLMVGVGSGWDSGGEMDFSQNKKGQQLTESAVRNQSGAEGALRDSLMLIQEWNVTCTTCVNV